MKLSKIGVLCVALMTVPMASCGGHQEQPVEVDVFVLTGQSNMEGATYYDNGSDWLRHAFETLNLDITPFEDSEGKVSKNAPGIENILTSYFGFYPPDGKTLETGLNIAHASNSTDKLAGKFFPTRPGMGSQDHYMGPEIGLSYALQEYASEDKPIYFIKCAFSGSGFTVNNGPSWINSKDENGYVADYNIYETLFTPFVRNNLQIIKDSGKVPVIKALLWHQGETDTGNSNYQTQMSNMIARFRGDFAEYAVEEDGNNIGFVDAYIYDGPNCPYGGEGDLNINTLKQQLAAESDNNYVINTSYHHDDGQEKMQLAINPNPGDVEGGDNRYHYKTLDSVKLGMAYAQVLINNGYLE